jgi:hypothetical protein
MIAANMGFSAMLAEEIEMMIIVNQRKLEIFAE